MLLEYWFFLDYGFFYALPLPQIINVSSETLLVFYGTTGGIFFSFIVYRNEKTKEKREKTDEYKPQLITELIRESKDVDVFRIKIHNYSKYILSAIYLYDEYVGSTLKQDSEYWVCYYKTKDEYENLKCHYKNLINITVEDNILDSDNFPKYIQLGCDAANGDMWDCMFNKRKDGKNIYYYPNFRLL